MNHSKTSSFYFASFSIAVCLLSNACGVISTLTGTPIAKLTSPTAPPDSLQAFFTNPESPTAQDNINGPDEALVADINRARLEVDVAANSLNLVSIRDALIQAHRRGVIVRMVMESDNMDSAEVQDLLTAEIPVIGDNRGGVMDDNFVILDHAVVWTGSMDFTTNGAYVDNNNMVRIPSMQAAADYTTRFEDMFSKNKFGPDAVVDTPYPHVTLDNTKMEIYFSPADGIDQHLLDILNGANDSIYFMAYSFTSQDLGDAILAQAKTGVKVAGIMDGSQISSNTGTQYNRFVQAGLSVRKSAPIGLMHHNVFIIDNQIVVMGSSDFTASSENVNDENVVIISDPQIATHYLAELQRLYSIPNLY